MATRAVIEIDEELCDGCGLCANGCHEGALRIIDGKARLVGESLCDGLGACIGDCPRGALSTIEREVEPYNERKVIENILPKGLVTIEAHLDHLYSHGQDAWYNEAIEILAEKGIKVQGPKAAKAAEALPVFESCAGSFARSLGAPSLKQAPAFKPFAAPSGGGLAELSLGSRLDHWPIQLHLVNPRSPHFRNAELLIAADCTAFACGAFHQSLLAGKKLVIACPKLDSGREVYISKIKAFLDDAQISSITLAIMDVPCCNGLRRMIDEAARDTSRYVPISTVVIAADGGTQTWL
ncbi:4Fe-4S binding protein [Spirochaetota bacterium]